MGRVGMSEGAARELVAASAVASASLRLATAGAVVGVETVAVFVPDVAGVEPCALACWRCTPDAWPDEALALAKAWEKSLGEAPEDGLAPAESEASPLASEDVPELGEIPVDGRSGAEGGMEIGIVNHPRHEAFTVPSLARGKTGKITT
jgi:hypothetical protein